MASAKVRHITFDHPAKEVSWELTMSKTDPMALGTTRTWGCLCGVPTLPCPYHVARDHVEAVLDFVDQSLDDSLGHSPQDTPLFCNSDGSTPSKADMVLTFEQLASRCDQPIHNRDGLRLFGGHSVRVTGAQALAACGIEVSKIRILARHSGEAILRYVAESPLRSLRSDLGLAPQASRSAPALAPSRPDAGIALLTRKLDSALATLSAHGEQLATLSTITYNPTTVVFVQNLTTGAVHALRAASGVHTTCGWFVGTARTARTGIRWLTSISEIPHWLLCERCLLGERRAAELAINENEPIVS